MKLAFRILRISIISIIPSVVAYWFLTYFPKPGPNEIASKELTALVSIVWLVVAGIDEIYKRRKESRNT